jgi:hypothetical protein
MSSGQINDTLHVRIVIDAAANATPFTVTCPRPLTILDAFVVGTAVAAGGTATVSSGGNDITDALACAAVDTLTRATSIDATFATLAAGDPITVTTNADGVRGEVVIICHAPGAALATP